MKQPTRMILARIRRGLTQRDIGDLLQPKMSQTWVSLVERKVLEPTHDLKRQISEILGIRWTKMHETIREASGEGKNAY